MTISGFSMAKNADKLGYPVKEAVLSILPLVDEFVFALGDCDSDDKTRELLESIDSDKLKIIDTVWDLEKYPRGMEHAHQSDIAKEHCSGDWLFYVQADEIVHEDDLPLIRKRCEELVDDREVEGLLFRYRHFWGDYDHYHFSHTWYKDEIRIIRNDPDIHSWESAQSFRRIPDFDGLNYRQQKGTYKLKVARVNAYIYHYGWVKPPNIMRTKSRALTRIHHSEQKVKDLEKKNYFDFNYGDLSKLQIFKGKHPEVMHERIKKFDWGDQLNNVKPKKPQFKHEKIRYKIVTFLENNIFHRPVFDFGNFILLKNK
ncbi:MAG: glycosyltransferase family 2 protein [Bacteroidales bacterium]|nr:glycosyltransferase family 2 protein [Bacteroidales bacterium]